MIREELHTPAICLECRNGTHTSAFMDKLETIRWERAREEEEREVASW
jgi:hypothetical protein